MKNLMRKTIVSLALFIVFFFTFGSALAQVGDYTVLTPLPGTTSECVGTACKSNLSTYLPNMFKLVIGIAAGLAFIMITLGGITYATSDAISGKSQGREWVTNALVGLLLVISAYVILYTINPQILTFNIGVTVPVATGGQASATAGVAMTQLQIDESNAVRAQLKSAGNIDTNAGPCVNGQTSGCTNLNGLPTTAINGLVSLKSACGCQSLMITGGTEPGAHATHGVGSPIVDLRPDLSLNKFISGDANTPRDGFTAEKVVNGQHMSFTYESAGGNARGTSTGDHWHVVIK